jgi:uncharacterized protein YjbJ (UPF0337 family)
MSINEQLVKGRPEGVIGNAEEVIGMAVGDEDHATIGNHQKTTGSAQASLDDVNDDFANTDPEDDFTDTDPKNLLANTDANDDFADTDPKNAFANTVPKSDFSNTVPKRDLVSP